MIKKRYVTSSGNILLFTSDDLSEAIAAADEYKKKAKVVDRRKMMQETVYENKHC
jgi:hypothetical protein